MSRPTARPRAIRRRYLILGSLGDIGPASTIAIAKQLGKGAFYAGSMNVDLVWLEHHGLITSKWEQPDGPYPRRRLYRLATQGGAS